MIDVYGDVYRRTWDAVNRHGADTTSEKTARVPEVGIRRRTINVRGVNYSVLLANWPCADEQTYGAEPTAEHAQAQGHEGDQQVQYRPSERFDRESIEQTRTEYDVGELDALTRLQSTKDDVPCSPPHHSNGGSVTTQTANTVRQGGESPARLSTRAPNGRTGYDEFRTAHSRHAAQSRHIEPLLLIHGFTGSAVSWQPVLSQLASSMPVVAVDLLGHGLSGAPRQVDRYTFHNVINDLLEVITVLNLQHVHVCGYSLGGRLALSLACSAPERVASLILESSTAGLEDSEERRQRVRADEQLAVMIEQQGIAAFVDYWEQLPLWDSQRTLPADVLAAQRRQRLQQRPRGLANSLRGLSVGVMPPLWGRLASLQLPVLLITGELDRKYCALARTMQRLLPSAQHFVVPGAGHNVHLEKPASFLEALRQFFEQQDRFIE